MKRDGQNTTNNNTVCACLSFRCSALSSLLLSVWLGPSTAPVWPQPVWLLDPCVGWPVNGFTHLKTPARECFSHHHFFFSFFLGVISFFQLCWCVSVPPSAIFTFIVFAAEKFQFLNVKNKSAISLKSSRWQTGPALFPRVLWLLAWNMDQPKC